MKYNILALPYRHYSIADCINHPYILSLLNLTSYKGNEPMPSINSNIDLDNTCDDNHIPFITLRNPIKYTILYYSVRNSISFLIDNPIGLVKHYTRIYNQTFCQNKGV